jgi:glycogen debranching enzyme
MAQSVAKSLNGVAKVVKKPTLVSIPKYHEPSETDAIRTPKTPQDEGIFWFEHGDNKGDPIQVYELELEPDGGPNKDRMVRRPARSPNTTAQRFV